MAFKNSLAYVGNDDSSEFKEKNANNLLIENNTNNLTNTSKKIWKNSVDSKPIEKINSRRAESSSKKKISDLNDFWKLFKNPLWK